MNMLFIAACFAVLLAIIVWLAKRLVSAEDNLTHERIKTEGLLATLRKESRAE